MKKIYSLIVFLMFVTFIFSSCGGGSSAPPAAPPAPLSSAKAISAFSFATPAATGTITEAAHTVAVTVPSATNVTALIPTITHTGASINPASGVVQNFSSPVTYTVTAADSSTRAYIVTVTIAPSGTPLIAFATSVQGTGDLSTWADAGGKTGVAAGDAVCQARATAGGLAGTYKAWLSDNTTDAYCHVQGFTGTISGVNPNCGQLTLPVAAGPWVRTNDGYPFAPTIDKLVNNNQVFAPVRYDESGNLLFAFTLYFTGTKPDGTVDTFTCVDWTSGLVADAGRFGGTEAASGWWTEQGAVGCSGSLNLLCLQTGAGGPLPSITAPTPSNKVFVTSVTGNGDLSSWADSGGVSGVAGGDAICQARATAAGLANAANFKAWLSDGSNDALGHVTVTAVGPWYRLDGVKIADTITDLTTAPLFTAIAVDENGAYITGDLWVWSGTDATGAATANRCSDWTSNAGGDHGKMGEANTASTWWTTFTDNTCDNFAALYCFEDD